MARFELAVSWSQAKRINQALPHTDKTWQGWIAINNQRYIFVRFSLTIIPGDIKSLYYWSSPDITNLTDIPFHPYKLGGRNGIRTHDLLLAKQAF